MRVHIGINCATKGDFIKKLKKIHTLFGRRVFLHIDIARKGFASINTAVDAGALKKINIQARTTAHVMLPLGLRVPRLFSFPASLLFFHRQYVRDWKAMAKKAARHGKKIGLALCVQDTLPAIPKNVGHVLILTVRPGRSEQLFSEKALPFIEKVKKTYPSKRLYVDGGITPFIAKKLARYEIQDIVSTSYVWNASDPREALQELARAGIKK